MELSKENSQVERLLGWVDQVTCPACGDPERKYWLRDRNRREGLQVECDFWKCRNCSTIYLSPLPGPDLVRKMYNEKHGAPQPRGYIAQQADRIVDTWARIWSPGMNRRGQPKEPGDGKKLLSIGCGYATQLQKYARNGWDVFGLDTDRNAVRWNQENLDGTYFEGAFEDHQFETTFDVIHCSAVIEHSYEPLKMLSKASDLLSHDGRILFFTPSGGSGAMRLLSNYSIAFWVPFHLVLFTPKGLRILAEKAGLRSSEVSTIAEPHLASLSIRQIRNRHKNNFSLVKGWDTRFTTLLLAPVWSILNQFGLGEELALSAKASKSDE